LIVSFSWAMFYRCSQSQLSFQPVQDVVKFRKGFKNSLNFWNINSMCITYKNSIPTMRSIWPVSYKDN
jgi:hypothetical protein